MGIFGVAPAQYVDVRRPFRKCLYIVLVNVKSISRSNIATMKFSFD